MGCPETLWMSHGWKHSRSDWMGLWETWSSERCPSPYQGGWTRWPLKVPSSPKHSVTLSKDFSWQQRPHPECLSLCLHNPAKPLLHTHDQFMCIWLQLLSPTSVNHLPSCMWLKNECFQPKPVGLKGIDGANCNTFHLGGGRCGPVPLDVCVKI